MADSLEMKMLRRLSRGTATPEEIAQTVSDDPKLALTFATDLLTDAQIASCAKRVPATALVFAWYRLPSEIQAQCVRRAPAMALRMVPHELSRAQFFTCLKRAPREAREVTSLFYKAEFEMNHQKPAEHESSNSHAPRTHPIDE